MAVDKRADAPRHPGPRRRHPVQPDRRPAVVPADRPGRGAAGQDRPRRKTRTVPLLPERGRIFDADGRILADNQRILTVAVDWQHAPQAHRPGSRSSAACRAGSACRSRRWRRATTPRSTARSCRCRQGRDVERGRRAVAARAHRGLPRRARSSRSGSACTRTRRTPPTSSATWARSPRTSRTTTSGRRTTCSTSGSASSASS